MLGSTPWHQRSSTLVPRPKEGPSRHNGSPWASSSGTPASKPAREQSRTPAEASYTLASPWISCHHISMRRGREASRGRQATTRGWAVCRRRVRAFVPAWRVSSSSSKKCLGRGGGGALVCAGMAAGLGSTLRPHAVVCPSQHGPLRLSANQELGTIPSVEDSKQAPGHDVPHACSRAQIDFHP